MKKTKPDPAKFSKETCSDACDCQKQPPVLLTDHSVLGIPGAALTVDGIPVPNLHLRYDSKTKSLAAFIQSPPGEPTVLSQRLQIETDTPADQVFSTIPFAICDLLLKTVCAEYVKAIRAQQKPAEHA